MTIVGRGLGQPESPLVTGGLGREDFGLRANLVATAGLVGDIPVGLRANLAAAAGLSCDLSVVAKQEGGGRKRKKKDAVPKERNVSPLLRVQFGDLLPSVQEIPLFTEHEQPAVPEQTTTEPAESLEPIEGKGVGRKALDDLLARVSGPIVQPEVKQVKQATVDSEPDFYDEAEILAVLELLD